MLSTDLTIEDVIGLIETAVLISEDDKARYLRAIESGRIDEDMEMEIARAFEQEAAQGDAQIAEMEEEIARQKKIRSEEYAKHADEVEHLVAEADEAMGKEVMGQKAEYAEMETRAERAAEEVAQEDTAGQIDEIKKNLGV